MAKLYGLVWEESDGFVYQIFEVKAFDSFYDAYNRPPLARGKKPNFIKASHAMAGAMTFLESEADKLIDKTKKSP
jgi:hypothetical protein